ncbi:MAG TPA: VCBS repeat-containing protein, partial [Chitinispirillaceae bacterium]|nr:VCBS repeat-containing protein [Chitinispirillaceae bacterium]
GDGLPEIVLYSDHEKAGEYVNRGNCLWVLNPDMTRVKGFETPLCSGMPLYTGYQDNIVQVAPAPAVGSIDGDQRPEIIVPSYDGYMHCFSPDGSLLWKYQFDNGKGKFIGASGAVVGDLNGDNIPEVVFTTYSIEQNVSSLILLDNKGTQLHKASLAKRGSMSPPCLADIDGDHTLEIVISLKDVVGGGSGGVQIWNVASASDNLLLWSTGRGNNLRNGQYTQNGSHNNSIRYRNRNIVFQDEHSAYELFNIRGQKTGYRKEASPAAGFCKPSTVRGSSGLYFVRKTGKNHDMAISSLLLQE